jgi:hypothetical protein
VKEEFNIKNNEYEGYKRSYQSMEENKELILDLLSYSILTTSMVNTEND